MIVFQVTLRLPQDEFVKLFSGEGFAAGTKFTVEAVGETNASREEPRQAQPAPARKKRGSKVEAAIIDALTKGAQMKTSDLKDAMERAGLKPTSLGTTISKMKKEGVVRNDNGIWSLAA